MTGSERNLEQLRNQPLTAVLLLAFSLTIVFGLIYVVVFSDTTTERWQHFYVAFAAIAFVGTCFALAKRREDRGPLSLGARRMIWGMMVGTYAVVACGIFVMGISPFSRFSDTLRLVCYLGAAAPLAYIPWHLLRTEDRANQSVQPTTGVVTPRAKGSESK